MLEDFLITSVWAKSNANVDFPAIYQTGYAYFLSHQYGFKAGKFYDESDMWLWLDRGIAEPDSVEIDYITARKDGTLGIALVNEGNAERTTTVALGEKVPGGADYDGTAVLYDANGKKSQVSVVNGKFTITIPSKGIQSVVLKMDCVKKPSYVNENHAFSTDLENTVATHTRGKAYALQISPKNYFAYVYITDMAVDAKKMTLTYQIGDGQKQTKVIDVYPFETIIKVDDPSKEFKYSIAVEKTNDATEDLGGNTLKAMTNGAATTSLKLSAVSVNQPPKATDPANVIAVGNDIQFEAFTIKPTTTGSGGDFMRFVVSTANFPFAVSEDTMTGMRIQAVMTSIEDGTKLVLDNVIAGIELRTGQTVIKVGGTQTVPLKHYRLDAYAIELTISPAN